MSSLIQTYEQQYSVLTADITSKIGRLKLGNEDNKEQVIKEIQANFDEANDLLEQLELETRGSGSGGSRVSAYRAEMKRVHEEFRAVLRPTSTYSIENEDLYEDFSNNSQRQKLLENTTRLERTGQTLTHGYRAALETEQVAAAVLVDLSHQRETIQRSRGRLRETDEQLNRSSRLMNSMIVRSLQDRFILVVVFMILGVLVCLSLYFYIT